MNKQAIFFCVLVAHATTGRADGQNSKPISPLVAIHVNASTNTGVTNHNDARQAVQQEPHQQTQVNIPITQINVPQAQPQKPLEFENSPVIGIAKSSLGVYAVYLLGIATVGTSCAPALPAFLVYRAGLALCTNNPLVDQATPEERKELAAQGKERFPTLAVFPAVHKITNALGIK